MQRPVFTPRGTEVANYSTGQQKQPGCVAVLFVCQFTESDQLGRGVANKSRSLDLPYLLRWEDGIRNLQNTGKSGGLRTDRNAKSVQFVNVPGVRRPNVAMRRASADAAADRQDW